MESHTGQGAGQGANTKTLSPAVTTSVTATSALGSDGHTTVLEDGSGRPQQYGEQLAIPGGCKDG